MPVARRFLDWSKPALPAVVGDLIAEYQVLGYVDLDHLLCIFPGRQAGRRFLELLAEKTGGRHSPPRVITLGDFPETLYEPQRPFASELVQKLAWGEALRSLPSGVVRTVARHLPDKDDLRGWTALGELFSKQHRELAADQLDFADVVERGQQTPDFNEQERWEVLSQVQRAYLALLDELGLWDKQTARLEAIKRKECRTQQQIVLVGTVDLNRTQRAMLDQVADKVTVYIHAPKTATTPSGRSRSAEKTLFDAYGCLVPEVWQQVQINLRSEQIQSCAGPEEQAAAVADILQAAEGKWRADDLSIGVPDPHLVPFLERTLQQRGVPTRWVSAGRISESAPFRLLTAVAESLESQLATSFATLVRHPDVTDWVNAQAVAPGWLIELDRYFAEHLPLRLTEWLGRPETAERLGALHELVSALLLPLLPPKSDPTPAAPEMPNSEIVCVRPLTEWTEPITDLLLTIYNHRAFDPQIPADAMIVDACRVIQQTLRNHSQVPDRLLPQVTAAQALWMVLEEVANEDLPPPPKEDAVPLVGWLELPLDDAPVAIVTSMNEGFVPGAINADLFLPNALRMTLGIEDNARRFARDAYALSVLTHVRQELRLIVARNDARGDLLVPSRLLFAAPTEQVAERVLELFPEGESESKTEPVLAAVIEESSDPPQMGVHEIPRPQRLAEPIREIRVTGFREYLNCPYGFYLSQVLKLRRLRDDAREMDALQFGSLMHEVLATFGRAPIAQSADPTAINQFLQTTLDQCAAVHFGRDAAVAVRVQIEQLRQRLIAFANWQADRAAKGWEIRFCEVPGHNRPLRWETGDGRFIRVVGTIDRIDYHAQDDLWTIFDYKTGKKVPEPEKTHRKQNEWVDLQLPLYRHLARLLGVTGQIQLAYIALPADTTQVAELIADWDDATLLSADKTAREVARQILDQEFWPPAAKHRAFDDFAVIRRTGVFGLRE